MRRRRVGVEAQTLEIESRRVDGKIVCAACDDGDLRALVCEGCLSVLADFYSEDGGIPAEAERLTERLTSPDDPTDGTNIVCEVCHRVGGYDEHASRVALVCDYCLGAAEDACCATCSPPRLVREAARVTEISDIPEPARKDLIAELLALAEKIETAADGHLLKHRTRAIAEGRPGHGPGWTGT